MSKRLYEIARDLGISSNELSQRVEHVELSFEIQNHLSVLDEDQVDELMRALQSAPSAERVQKRVSSGLIRRRARKTEEGAEGAPSPDVPAEEPVAAEPEEAADEPVVRRRKMATVVTRPEALAPKAAPAPEPEPEPAASEEEVPAVRPRQRIATVVTREVPVAEAAPPADVPAAPRSRFATVVTNPSGRATTAAPSATELAAFRTDTSREASRGGAKVVGTVNPDLLSTRLEADKKDFGPRRPEDRAKAVREKEKDKGKKKGGKRVVQSRDLYSGGRPGRGRKGKAAGPAQSTQITQAAEHKRVVKMEDSIIIGDLAHQMSIKAGEVAMKLMFDLGIKGANINTAIDFDTAQLVAEMYGFKIEQVGFDIDKYLPQIEDDPELELFRPPVVTVMGHVDHGKTSLLDAIRNASVATGEAGGITQHIGAYQVELDSGRITFLDTPGHEAFTALRARGAQATDIAILVVAADDGVMPQTVEAINHAKDAGVPIIVAVNKCDKENANPERVRQALSEYALIPEEWGGSTIFVDVSALTQKGIPTLLEMIHLQAELLELKARPDRPATGLVIESKLDVGRGPVATVLVQAGTLKKGDTVVVGEFFGRVRTLNNERGEHVEDAGPSVPVEVTGLNGVPAAGEHFHVVDDVENAKIIAEHIGRQNRQADLALSAAASGGLDALGHFMRSGELKEIKVIVKGDVQGSVEALTGSLQKLGTEKVTVRIIHAAVGGITESDVNLAASSEEGVRAVIVGFNVRADNRSSALAEQYGVTIMISSIIYEIIDAVKMVMTGMLEPIFKEEVVGHAEVRATFTVPKVGVIAGCMVTDGMMMRNAHIRLKRGGEVVVDSVVGSLRHFEKNVAEVKAGFECGLSIDRHDDVRVGDILECYKLVETAATL